jgi:antitoxin ParD1/3/4
MNVTLKPELEKLVEDEVKSGRSTDPNEFLNKAVYHYVLARDLGEEYAPEEIDRMIAEGLDDIERGDTVDGEEALRQLRAHSAERRRQRA